MCVSTQRIFVHAEREEEFTERFATRVASLRVGDPSDMKTEVGPLIHPKEADRVESWISEATAGGASLTGGKRLSDTLLEPAILRRPQPDAKVSRQEAFGPLVSIYPFTDMAQAIKEANSLPYAFQASLFTQDLDTAFHVAEELDASAVMINDHTAFRTDWMPFAGRRSSGYGVGGIPFTMRDMTQLKTMIFRRKS